MRSVRGLVARVSIAVIAVACTRTASTAPTAGTSSPSGPPVATGLDKLEHLIFEITAGDNDLGTITLK